MRQVRIVVGVVAALGMLLSSCARPAPAEVPLAPVPPDVIAQRQAAGIADCPASDASAPSVDGGMPRLIVGCLGSDATVNLAGLGRPAVINVWAQWCAPCRQEAPHLRAFADRVGDRIVIMGLDYDDPDPALALEFAEYVGWRYPHVTDPGKRTAGPLGITGIPLTLFVAADGTIAYRHVGVITSPEQLEELSTQWLGVS